MIKGEFNKERVFQFLSFVKNRLIERWGFVLSAILLFLIFLILKRSNLDIPIKLCALALILSVVLILFMGKEVHKNAFAIILCFGLLFSFTTPVFDTPDENAHMLRTLYTVGGNLVLTNIDEDLNVSKDYDNINSQFGKNIYENNIKDFHHDEDKVGNIWLKVTNAYSFISYIPQSIGVIIGRVLNLDLYWIFYLGRIINLLFYGLVISYAIKITPIFKNVFLVAATIPIAVYMASSYNQDVFSMALGFLIVAYYIYLFNQEKNMIGIKEISIYTLLCSLMAFTKLPYVLLIGLIIFIAPEKFKKRSYYLVSYLSIVVVACVSIIWLKQYASISPPNTLVGVSMDGQLRYIFSEPLKTIKLIGNVLLSNMNIPTSMFLFGWLSYGSSEIGLIYLFFLGAMMIFYPREDVQVRTVRWGSFLVSSAIYIAICLSMYMTWTPVGADYIQGIQGRYFVGLLVLMSIFMNIGPRNNQLDPVTLNKYNLLVTYIPIYFLLISFTLTLNKYY